MTNRYLILGSLGMLGRAWRELLDARRIPFDHGDRDEIDITDAASIERAMGGRNYTHVINCAAWTDVDAAEANEAGATLLNGTAVGFLADACARHGAMLVHYSTDYVFDGEATTPYRTDQPRDPLNAYGRGKAAGEIALERFGAPSRREGVGGGLSASSLRWLCLRTSWLYAPWGKNFVRTIGAAALSRPQLKVVHDQRGRPTSAEHLARVSLAMIEAGASGMHHATDGGECTWFEFACHIVECLRQAQSQREGGGVSPPLAGVTPCTSAEFPRPAKRPAYSVLDISRTEALVGPMPDWRRNLEDVMQRLEA